MAEFEIEGDHYQTTRMAPKVQMRMLKRLARIAPALKTGAGLADKLKDGTRPNIDEIATALEPVIGAFADMADEDVEFIIETSLDHARHQPAGQSQYFKVRSNGLVSNQINEELTRSVMIAFFVIRENFETILRKIAPDEAAA